MLLVVKRSPRCSDGFLLELLPFGLIPDLGKSTAMLTKQRILGGVKNGLVKLTVESLEVHDGRCGKALPQNLIQQLQVVARRSGSCERCNRRLQYHSYLENFNRAGQRHARKQRINDIASRWSDQSCADTLTCEGATRFQIIETFAHGVAGNAEAYAKIALRWQARTRGPLAASDKVLKLFNNCSVRGHFLRPGGGKLKLIQIWTILICDSQD